MENEKSSFGKATSENIQQTKNNIQETLEKSKQLSSNLNDLSSRFEAMNSTMNNLNQMFLNKATINTIAAANGGSSFSTTINYWSSTENGWNNAWYQYFADGGQSDRRKHNTYGVRAVRAF